ncbi:MAG: PAS domain-containing protein [Myxococcales bacterium]|nr:PAS domain-containing protein [Myxococcales bacterium]
MADQLWYEKMPVAVTVCDRDGVIVDMNEKAGETFRKWGGKKLIGQSLLDYHPEPARAKLVEMLRTQQANTYYIEKAGRRKIIHQTPWRVDGEYRGFVEISFELPDELPTHKRG